MFLYAGVDTEGKDEIHCGVWDGAEDAGGHADVPVDVVLFTEGPEEVFLLVVEIGF
jgi:hypothetical protein